jgi:hypothetical protein
VVTKVSAKNFYLHKNRNINLYLIENCLKGVSSAVILERAGVSQYEMSLIHKILENVNFSRSILVNPGRTFALKDLSKVLSR